MTETALQMSDASLVLPDLLGLTGRELEAADGRLAAAERHAWMATYVEALRQMRRWAEGLEAAGQFREAERLILQSAFGEYLAQLAGGIALSQVEIVRPGDLGVGDEALHAFRRPEVAALIRD